MDLDWIWKSVLIVLGGTFLLRIAGRKSISQMTLAQTVIMVGIGSLLIQPIAGKNIWVTLGVGGILVLTLITIEYAQIKSDVIENLITGKSKIVIENGTLNDNNLKKLRLTVDQLEMKLRQQNATTIENIQWATLEPNGQIGFILKQDSQPATKKDIYMLQQNIQQINNFLTNSSSPILSSQKQPVNQQELFSEVKTGSHNIDPPKHLQ